MTVSSAGADPDLGRAGPDLRPYLPRLTLEWLADWPDTRWRSVEGTLAFVDISGFTSMTERLARRGKVGAEEVSDILDACFGDLLAVSDADGADLVKWGGDAVLLLFRGADHALRACRAAAGMRRQMRRIGQLRTSAGQVRLRMSVGIHSGRFHFFLVGDLHRELVLTGPAATTTARMEALAEATEIVISPATAALLPASLVGPAKDDGLLLAAAPPGTAAGGTAPLPTDGLDVAACLPIAIRDHLLSGVAHGEAEHRPITAAFLEFRGTDDLLARPGGEDVTADALDQLMRSVQHAAAANGVSFFETDINADGGKVMLIAGAPRSSGHDEEGMLRTVREILAASEEGLTRSPLLGLRLGVNAGRVFAGGFGPTFRRTYSVKGDAVNLAARLMAKAGPGRIFATEGVLARSRTIFAATALAPFLVKGKAAPVQAFDVGPATGQRSAAERPELPLVGRAEEMTRLTEALADARLGHGRVVELIGEPGIGKSRLVEELRRGATDIRAVTATCDEYGATTPYLPFRGLLRELVGCPSDAEGDQAASALRSCVSMAAPELLPWLPLIAVVTHVAVPATPETDALGEAFRKPRLESAVSTLLARLLPSPSLLVFDDVHWMDEASASLLLSLCREAAERPWMLLALRNEQGTGFVAPGVVAPLRIHPGPIEPAAAAMALAAATEDDPLPPHVVDALATRSGGNPLFLGELLAAARGRGGTDDLPGSIEEVVAGQLDRLAPLDRLLLRYAAVLGMRFDDKLLDTVLAAAAIPADAGAWDRLGQFIARDPRGGFRFRHALFRDAAYERLAFRRRRELHARVGDAILRQAGRRPDAQAELLSLHFFHAGRFDAAWRYSRIAGDRARAAYANVEAAEFYARAIDAGRRVRDVAPREQSAVLEALGDARVQLGEFPGAQEAFQAARGAIRDDPVADAKLVLKISQVAWQQGRYPQALRWTGRGLHGLADRLGTAADSARAQLTVQYGAVRQQQGRAHEAVRWCRRAIGEATEAGDRDALAHAYYILDWALFSLGRTAEAIYSSDALAIYETLGDLAHQAAVLNNLGGYAYFEGRWDDALAHYERARAAYERIGAQLDAAFPAGNIAEILVDQGRLAEAEPLLRQALRVYRAAERRSSIAFV
ncbi:MAG TPA: adenylate/guanylate cyclase domain-containing protein, partial [Candidatus Limnocylindrales bacterium]|nr:adenylate/guanylate cyclase domain-containing protein [Candidatus Limnocylindrales bacterium]